MIGNERFLDLVDEYLGRNLRDPQNKSQLDAVVYDGEAVLQVVAGPGSGKTTVLVLRALRHMLVEDVLPEHILITTFTRKAAGELRTRWLDWGTSLLNAIGHDQSTGQFDINRCSIDTLDSIVQEVLTEYRPTGELAPALVDNSASLLIFKREVFQSTYWDNREELDALLSRYTFDRKTPRNQGEALKTSKHHLERLIQDKVDTLGYATEGYAEQILVDMLDRYRQVCLDTNVFDFTTLEELFLNRLADGHLKEWSKDLRVLLVDEYQDTNPLQEAIYFSLIQSNKLATAIVGDDDQSMYRFRGGSVELFTDFVSRCRRATGRDTNRTDMVRNFRSRPEIICFFNNHIAGDPAFQPARIRPSKPEVTPARISADIPVLGMFREDEQTLANDLAAFLQNLADGKRITVGDSEVFRLDQDGAIGDAVFLAHSVDEVSYDRYNGTPQDRFPGLLRSSMESRGLQVFNPRGQSLRSIPDMQKLLGLVLLSMDPDNDMVDTINPTSEARYFLRQWRKAGQIFVDEDPAPNDGKGLAGFIQDWQKAAAGQVVKNFPADWPILEIIFKLITWLSRFQTEPEHQVWLEAAARIIASATMASPYGMQLLQNVGGNDQGNHVRRSRESLIRDALTSIAENEVQTDEEIMPSVPRDRLQFMTIH